MSSFGHKEIEYSGDTNDEVRPLLFKDVSKGPTKTKKARTLST